jgi:hypothetical protein
MTRCRRSQPAQNAVERRKQFLEKIQLALDARAARVVIEHRKRLHDREPERRRR